VVNLADKAQYILIIDDEFQIRRLLKVALESKGYHVVEAETAQDGINMVASHKPDLVILDLGLPDFDGKYVMQRIREWSQVPIIILTVQDQESEKIQTLDSGADDYLTKPFRVGELMARIRAALRRANAPESQPEVSCGDMKIDFLRRSVTIQDQEIRLTATEYEVLKVLAQYPGRVITHDQLLKAVWGAGCVNTHYTRIYIGLLRRKIEADSAQPRYILTESGVGYRLNY
jgi:two-component system, OmpR family, KDP operon response regulator KdpE